jgi:DNA-binding XRE family transcriptional regulator
MSAYQETYLYHAMKNLGEAMQTACEELSLPVDEFVFMFITSGIASQYEKGNPKYVAGKTGREIAFEVYEKTFGEVPAVHSYIIGNDPSPEYWVGWILAYYQWHSGRSFHSIQNTYSAGELLKHYHPLHEADEMKTVDIINNRFQKQSSVNRLREYRKRLGLSQSELAAQSGVHLRSIQQYEIGAKDIKKASVTTVIALSKALNCDTESLLN